MKPRAGYHEIGVLWIIFPGVTKNLPRTPRVFLIPETGDVQIGHGGGVQLVDPSLLLPEFVIVGMIDGRIPVWNRPVQIFRIDVRQRTHAEIPLVSVVGFELEMCVLVLVGLFHDRVFKVVAFAERAETVVVVVHPLIHRRGLLADGSQRRVRMEERECGREAIIGDAEHPHLAVVIGNVFNQPLHRIIGIGGLVRRLGVIQINP